MDNRVPPQDQKVLLSNESSRKMSTDQRIYGQLKQAVRCGNKDLIDSLLDGNMSVTDTVDFRNLRPILHSSIYVGDAEIVKKLLDRDASVNVSNYNDETPLMIAAKMGNNVITDLLLSTEGLQNCKNREKLTHLHIASMRNQVNVVKSLIKSKKDTDAAVHSSSISWPGYTALHFAVHYHSVETVEYLLSIGADITIADARKLTPLHLANITRNERIIDAILLHHKNVMSNPVNSEGMSHFHIACTRNHADVIRCFIENGANLQDSVSESSLNWPRFTAMDFAIYYECVDAVKILLQCGDRVKAPHEYYDRATAACLSGNMDLVNSVIQDRHLKDKDGDDEIDKIPSLLKFCINSDMENVRRLLLETPSSLNELSWKGNSPLHLAIESGNVEVIKYLLSQGANYELKNSQGKSALHLAFDRNMHETMSLILRDYKNFSQNLVDDDGISHFHIACSKGYVIHPLKRLIKLGADINAPVNSNSVYWAGFTPLHFAVEFQALEAAEFLLSQGASYASTDARNLSPFDLAIKHTKDVDRIHNTGSLGFMEIILKSHETRRLDSFNDRGFSHLHLMCTNFRTRVNNIKEYLSKHPSDVAKSVQRLDTPYDGYTPLHFAFSFTQPESAKLLLESGADMLSKADNGDTPLYLAMWRRRVRPFLELLHDYLQKHQEPVEIKTYSFFHIVCVAGDIKMIKYHLENGADPNGSTGRLPGIHDNLTPLHLIAGETSSPSVEVAELLIKYGANPNARDSVMNTPLHCVINHYPNQYKLVETLIQNGADVNARNANLETPLLLICTVPQDEMEESWVYSEIVKSYLNYGADINLTDDSGSTPLTVVNSWIIINRVSARYLRESYLGTVDLLLKHVIRLTVIGDYVSEINQQAYSSLLKKYSTRLNFKQTEFEQQCAKEIELLKKTGIDRYTSLFHILSKNLNELAVTIENDSFQVIMNSSDFEKDFPIYGYKLNLQLKKGMIRRPLVMKSLKVLNFLTGSVLPRSCTEQITQYLDNDDLSIISTYEMP